MGNCTALCSGADQNKEGGKEFHNGTHFNSGSAGAMTKEKVEQEYEHAKALVDGGINFDLDGLNLEQLKEKDSTNPNSKEEYNDQCDPTLMQNPGERQTLPPHKFENGAIYTGEWLNGKRDGMGI